ncbi:MAG: hypothetical protein ACI9B9_001993 [Halioglobus sp.]
MIFSIFYAEVNTYKIAFIEASLPTLALFFGGHILSEAIDGVSLTQGSALAFPG